MKNLLFVIVLLTSVNIYSQQEELFYNDWRLFNLNIDGQNYTHTSNEEVSNVVLGFRTNPESLITEVCNSLEGELVYNNSDNNFAFPNGISTTLIECDSSDNTIYEALYFNFFNDNVGTPFTYFVGHADFPEWWFLTIYADNGDYAEYEWYFLATQDRQNIDFTLFPNPISDEFFVSFTNVSEKVNLTIYNILGEIVLIEKNYQSNTSIDVNNFNSGIYFVSIKDELGNTTVKKLIKK